MNFFKKFNKGNKIQNQQEKSKKGDKATGKNAQSKQNDILHQSIQSITSQILNQVPEQMKQQCQCGICLEKYNLTDRVPMNICYQMHHACLQCVNSILGTKRICPFCKTQININNIHKNRMIANMLSSAAKKKGKKLKVNQNPEKSLKGYNYIQKAPQYPSLNNPLLQNNNVQNQVRGLTYDQQLQRNLNLFQVFGKKIEQIFSKKFVMFLVATIFYLLISIPDIFIATQNKPQQICDDYFDPQTMSMTLRQYAKASAAITFTLGGIIFALFIMYKKLKQKKYIFAGFLFIFFIFLTCKFHFFNWTGVNNYDAALDKTGYKGCDHVYYIIFVQVMAFWSYMGSSILYSVILLKTGCFCGICDQSQ